MKPKYTVIIYTPQELNHSSNFQTGLFELEKKGFLNLKIKLGFHKNKGVTEVAEKGAINKTTRLFQKASYYKLIDNHSGKSIYFAVDLYDFSNQFSTVALEKCDYIFKRNYESKYIKQLPIENQNKIFRYGLSFGVHSKIKRKDYLFFISLFIGNLTFKLDRNLLGRLYKNYVAQLNHWNFIKTTRKIERFENFEKPEVNSIFFQTRCFQHEEQKDVKEIHQQRYRIIKLLKKTYPKLFLGGFIPSKISNILYKDALSNVPSEPEQYLNALKKAKIVIYTRGLANSPAWKMAEYLSQGKVIIAEPLTAELPVPLVHGKEVLFFNTDEELIYNINSVLENDLLAKELSENARLYFETHVHPVKNVKRILNSMIINFDNH
ncbi:glycosyltransferase [uncultured Lutibacter sp.]|uniref:glycosyltransferase n=1 Tax=uncultured Lutibacter sp. TaxID=437739 RepID=UPI00260E972B|nr:glycosyltransferase [uncultured Lutibacter sp.]